MLVRPSVLFPLLGLALAGCGSGGDPSANTAIHGVLVVPSSNGDQGDSNGTFIEGAALGAAGFVVATGENCGTSSCGSSAGYAVTFQPAAAQSIAFANSATTQPQAEPQEVALSGNTALWAAPQNVLPAPTCTSGFAGIALWSASAVASASQVPLSATFPLATPASSGCSSTNEILVGLVADSGVAYVAVAEPPVSSGGNYVSPDSPCWLQGAAGACSGSTVAHVAATGFIYALAPGASPTLQVAPPAVSTTFDPATAIHTLVEAGNDLCWLDASAHVSCVPKGWATGAVPTPTQLQTPALPKGWSFVAIASNGGTLAWAASPDVATGATGCLVWTSVGGGAATAVYDGSQADFFCRGLAIDGQFAYVTMNEVVSMPCSGCSSAYVAGSGIARIPLGGGALETLPLQSQEWYGPRRVFVDDTSVYAVDPSYVVQIDKTAFGP